nr:immunoglobulin light chain junction region [Macaca mulatta]MOV84337.1 immunoglobulin light chain junction region [Macaca mulatta]
CQQRNGYPYMYSF